MLPGICTIMTQIHPPMPLPPQLPPVKQSIIKNKFLTNEQARILYSPNYLALIKCVNTLTEFNVYQNDIKRLIKSEDAKSHQQ